MGLGKACKKKIIYRKFQFENISVVKPILLKIYYWEKFDIDGLNKKLNSNDQKIHHVMHMVQRYCNSHPIKIIFWVRNTSNEQLELRMKRLQNCQCQPLQTRVGFNQFRQLYHCPHRKLIHVLQELHVLQPNDLVALSMTFYFFLFGDHVLTFELCTSDGRTIVLDIHLHVTVFEPGNCVLTRELLPSDLKQQNSLLQPIWIINGCLEPLNLNFNTTDSRLKIMNPNLTVPQQSIWPLITQFKATDAKNDITLDVGFGDIKTQISLHGEGLVDFNYSDISVPNDYECSDASTVIYPNTLNFTVEAEKTRSVMVAVHNFGSKCWEYHWQSYTLPDIFEIKFKPKIFRLKPRHTYLCVVSLKTFKMSVHFNRIPCILEVHRNFDKPTKIARALLKDIESIDNPKWKEDSYVEHYFLNVNIKMLHPEEIFKPYCDYKPLEAMTFKKSRDILATNRLTVKTIFEKKYWEELSNSNFMRKNEELSLNLNYEEVLNYSYQSPQLKLNIDIDVCSILSILCEVLSETLRDISKNWIFIPPDYVGCE